MLEKNSSFLFLLYCPFIAWQPSEKVEGVLKQLIWILSSADHLLFGIFHSIYFPFLVFVYCLLKWLKGGNV